MCLSDKSKKKYLQVLYRNSDTEHNLFSLINLYTT